MIVCKRDGFEWLDIVDPSRPELEALGARYQLPESLVQDCLEPEHLPKHERVGDLGFLILRAYDEQSTPDGDTVRELTRKVAVFYCSRFVITVHRKPQPYFARMVAQWRESGADSDTGRILANLFGQVLETYETPLERGLDQLEELEMEVFEVATAPAFRIEEGYYLKRRAAVFRRMLRATLELLPRIGGGALAGEAQASTLQDLRETGERLYIGVDDLGESVNTLLNLHISLSSQRTNQASHRINEVVRILTIFSVFLLPLNVITGIYGMNFEHMPELKWPHGYPFALSLMGAVTLFIYMGFRRKGWLKSDGAA